MTAMVDMFHRKPFLVGQRDVQLFEGDMSPAEFDYFQKHLEAFKSMWNEKTVIDKAEFVIRFFNYAEEYGYIREFPVKAQTKMTYFECTRAFLMISFAEGKFSTAKHLLFEIACLSENRERVSNIGCFQRRKDPFFSKETKEVFRRFFGEPTDPNIFKKTIATLPLYTRFGGAVCRVLRRWIEQPSLAAQPSGIASPINDEVILRILSDSKSKSKSMRNDNFTGSRRSKSANLEHFATHFFEDSDRDFFHHETTEYGIGYYQIEEKFSLSESENVIRTIEVDVSFGKNSKCEDDVRNENKSERTQRVYQNKDSKTDVSSKDSECFSMKDTRLHESEEDQRSKNNDLKSCASGRIAKVDQLQEKSEENEAKNFETSSVKNSENAGALSNRSKEEGEDSVGKPIETSTKEKRDTSSNMIIQLLCNENVNASQDGNGNDKATPFYQNTSRTNGETSPKLQNMSGFMEKKFEEMKLAGCMRGKPSKNSTTRKCHHCRNCDKIEPMPKTYKKCALCKGKGTRFYCSKSCQAKDWRSRHFAEHVARGLRGCNGYVFNKNDL